MPHFSAWYKNRGFFHQSPPQKKINSAPEWIKYNFHFSVLWCLCFSLLHPFSAILFLLLLCRQEKWLGRTFFPRSQPDVESRYYFMNPSSHVFHLPPPAPLQNFPPIQPKRNDLSQYRILAAAFRDWRFGNYENKLVFFCVRRYDDHVASRDPAGRNFVCIILNYVIE